MRKKIIVSLIAVQISLSGCAAILPMSVMGTAMFISDERSVGKMIDDKLIYTNIVGELSKKGGEQMFLGVTVNVLEGRVLLTGNVLMSYPLR
jgi:osmotically-inducible protein OsmY